MVYNYTHYTAIITRDNFKSNVNTLGKQEIFKLNVPFTVIEVLSKTYEEIRSISGS